jgi:hypothetical protein
LTGSLCLRRSGLAWLVLAVMLTTTLAAAPAPADIERGRQLFGGEAALVGRVTGHTTDLPAPASRCANCHRAGTAPPSTAGSASPTSFGPVLNADVLTREIPRRGGPPSRYDEQAFCKLLATGVDPAYVIVPRNMPRYTLPPADCRALWLYLSQPRP